MFDAITPVRLGLIESSVPCPHYRIQCGPGVRLGNAGADRHVDRWGIEAAATLAKPNADAVSDDEGSAWAGAGKDDRKFFPTDPP